MVGFFFAGKHSLDFKNVVMAYAQRGLRPSIRRNDYEISGRDGTVDFGEETFDTHPIPINIYLLGTDENNLRELAREVAFWLSGKGSLRFDDEPHREHDAAVYNSIDAEQFFNAKRATVTFECQPFAKSINFLQSVNPGIPPGFVANISSEGTQRTPARITLRNTGNTTITNLTVSRRALRR